MLEGKTRNEGYPYETLKHGENEMKQGEALQGYTHLKANRKKVSQEKRFSKNAVDLGKRHQRRRKLQEEGDS